MKINITTPLTKEKVLKLHAGDEVLLSGVIYTSRDAGHKRMVEGHMKDGTLPVDLTDGIIYFVGPTPAKPGRPVGSCGPTTSYRMDAYSPYLIENCGLTGMIGKGRRNERVKNAMKQHKAVYFGVIGGAGALIAKSVKKSEVLAYRDLGAEALHKFTVEDMPLTVVIDCYGNDLYEQGVNRYLESVKKI